MGRAIAIGVVVIAVVALVAWLVLRLARQDERREDKRAGRAVNGDLNAKQERALLAENQAAAIILRRLIQPPSSLDGEIILLPDDLHTEIERWVKRHETRKEPTRP